MRVFFSPFRRSYRRTSPAPRPVRPCGLPVPDPANQATPPEQPLLRPEAEQMAFAALLETARSRSHWRPANRGTLQLALTLETFRQDALQEGLGWYFLIHPDRAAWQCTTRALTLIGAEELAEVFQDACRNYQQLDHFGPGRSTSPPFAAEEERLWEMKAARRLQRRANRFFWQNAPWEEKSNNRTPPM